MPLLFSSHSDGGKFYDRAMCCWEGRSGDENLGLGYGGGVGGGVNNILMNGLGEGVG